VFDAEKLLWMNGQHLMRMTAAQIYPHLVPFLGDHAKPLDEIRAVIDMNKPRARTLKDVAAQMIPYLADDTSIVYEDEAMKKHLKGDDLVQRMSDLRDALAQVDPFDVQTSEHALRALAEAKGLGAGKYIHPMRVALLGVASSPPIFDVAVTLGKERTLRRLDALISRL
jgi:glutamyl-tRNA synthetase